jgi:hypothetical protein
MMNLDSLYWDAIRDSVGDPQGDPRDPGGDAVPR